MDNNSELITLLNGEKTWAIHQFNKDENGNDLDSRELFPQIPTPLVIDFFASNSVDELKIINDEKIFLKATGIDAVQWSYFLISPQSIS
ncbi:MAG: hypothetical protein H8E72_06035 [Candidatus Marinimicrobia bacterium]|nr:hypothetical protein [Candidatus Neomarinimicrobiota bacterium]